MQCNEIEIFKETQKRERNETPNNNMLQKLGLIIHLATTVQYLTQNLSHTICASQINYVILPKDCTNMYKTSKMQCASKIHNPNCGHGNFLRIQRLVLL